MRILMLFGLAAPWLLIPQVGGPGGDSNGGGGGPGGGPGPVAITVVPGRDVAVGTTVNLGVAQIPGATYSWRARPVGCNPAAPWRTQANWNFAAITDCVGAVGTTEYEVTVTGPVNLKGKTTVTTHGPTKDVFQGLGAPSTGAAPLFINEIRIKQVWTDAAGVDHPLGPCCSAFVQENVGRFNNRLLKWVDSGWIPKNPPNDNAFFFNSPDIIDIKKTSTPANWPGVPNKVIDKFRQRYLITIPKVCGGTIPYRSKWYYWQRRKVNNNTLVIEPIPGM